MKRPLASAMLGLLAAVAAADDSVGDNDAATIWDGVYTVAQAGRGEAIYPAICGRCHGYRLDGAADDPDFFPTPPIAGPKFLRQWNGASLAALFEYTRATMPEINPGSLSDQEFVDVLSYMLAMTGAVAGDRELLPDADSLGAISISPQR